MTNIHKEELVACCQEVLAPILEEIVERRVKQLQEMLEIVARGVHELHERWDERA